MSGCALLYVRDGFQTSGRKRLMGRHAAGESFLKGLARHYQGETLGAVLPDPKDGAHLKSQLSSWQAKFSVEALAPGDDTGLQRHGVYFRPDPHIAQESWMRLRSGEHAYALCGVTHTISSENALDALSDLAVAPLAPHDALICTSRAVEVAVRHVMDAMEAHMVRRYGGKVPPRPMLPVIPLGVHTDDFRCDPSVRSAWRARMGASEQDLVLLWFGRLSFHAKAQPHVLFRAAEAASGSVAGKVHIVLSGWFADAHQEKVFREGAARLCPNVQLHIVDGRDPRVRREAWSCGDAFVLPVDNIQETFGLAPLEAMAAGLVPIVPAWNGFRDTVRHGETGLLLPCAAPPPGSGEALIKAMEAGQLDYDRYLAAASQSVWVDERALREAILSVARDPQFRGRLAAAGQAHARQAFDWSVVMPQYHALWQEQAARRVRAAGVDTAATAPRFNPRRPDPFNMFAHYPDHRVTPEARVSAKGPLTRESIQAVSGLPGAVPIPQMLLGMTALLELVKPIEAGPVQLGTLVSGQKDVFAALRTLMWLAKLGLVTVDGLAPQDTSGQPLPPAGA